MRHDVMDYKTEAIKMGENLANNSLFLRQIDTIKNYKIFMQPENFGCNGALGKEKITVGENY